MSQPELINGQICFNCTQVDRAKALGVDPSRTLRAKALGVDPSQILPDGQIKPKPSADGGSAPSATSPASATAAPTATALGVNQPLAAGTKGTTLNLLA
jgi:hypothetical protein